MREMRLVDAPSLYPGTCACGSQVGPLVDTMITNHQGRLYLCPRCVATFAGLHGYATPDEFAARGALLEVANNRIAELELSLADAIDKRMISVGELRRELAGQQT